MEFSKNGEKIKNGTVKNLKPTPKKISDEQNPLYHIH